jgi:hypothetical protein
MLEFDWSKGIPGMGKGVKREPFEDFTVNCRNNKIVVIS